MGVDDLPGMDTPENKGGRPKGSTSKDKKTSREVDGDPYTKDDGDEYWEEVWELNHTREGSMRTDILNTAQYTSCLPRTVVENLHNRGIVSMDEIAEDPPEWFKTHLESIQLEGINTIVAPSPDDKGGGTTSSGLSSLIGGGSSTEDTNTDTSSSDGDVSLDELLDDDDDESGLDSLLN